MSFDDKLARLIAHIDSPRDKARYFEGREHEITEFRHGVEAAENRDQAIFRIYQGAPGSGKTMLAELDPGEADSDALQHLARMSAAWSFGWPRHLLSAQKAICGALLQANGNFRDLSFPNIEQRCAEMRADYYEERMQDVTEYADHPKALLRVLTDLQTKRTPQSLDHLALLCGGHINRRAATTKPPEYAAAVAQHMVAKGLVERKDGVWTLPIPSMAAWAEQELKRTQPSPR